jgi:hypothetical protein
MPSAAVEESPFSQPVATAVEEPPASHFESQPIEEAPAYDATPQFEPQPAPEVSSFEPAPEYKPEPVAEHSGAMVFESAPAQPAELHSEASPFQRPAEAFTPAPPPPAPATVGVEQGIEPVGGVVSTKPVSRLSDRNVDLPIEVPDEEKRLHNDARRFARLLVSEIKLYNEKKVLEGRQAYDLYERLQEAIDRSREMYDKRVQPPVAARFDYFHFELVNALAEGNPDRLGNAYPGATV